MGSATGQAWPRKQGHVLCATAGLPHSWLPGRVWGSQPCSATYSDQIVIGHNQESLRRFSLGFFWTLVNVIKLIQLLRRN